MSLGQSECPACSTPELATQQNQTDIEFFGPVILTVTMCRACGYRHSDALTLQAKQPMALTLKVSKPEDLNLKVVRASTATTEIPELGAEITPGLHSEGYVTNVEGILERFKDTMSLMTKRAKGSRMRRAQAVSHKLSLARKGKFRFTLILKDPLGNSVIVSQDPTKVRSRTLSAKKLSKLKFGEYALSVTMNRAPANVDSASR